MYLRKRLHNPGHVLAAGVFLAWAVLAVAPPSSAAQPSLPDWSGVWLPDQVDQARQIGQNPTPWDERAASKVAQMRADERAGRPHGIFVNCLPEGMPSWMLISHNAMEILFTPGRVTLLGESDGNRLRRIYTDGRPHPADPDPTFHGHSIGHWEGQTLVVDTVGIDPGVLLAVSEAVGLPNNGDVHVVERLHLVGPDTLHDDLEITAPHLLTHPWTTTRVFNRQRGRDADFVEGVCLQGSFKEQTNAGGDTIFVPRALTEDGNRAPEK